MFAERFALLYAEAGNPPLKRVAESVARTHPIDERGQPVRVAIPRISEWRRGRNVPARFSSLSPVLDVLIGQARRSRPRPVAKGLYDLDEWRALWRSALDSPANGGSPEGARPAGDTSPQVPTMDAGVCPYRGLAAFREQDASWFFGRERSSDALLAGLNDALATGGIVMLVGASGAGKSSLLRAGLIPALAAGALPVERSAEWPVVVMTPGANPLARLIRFVPGLAEVLKPMLSESTDGSAPPDGDAESFALAVREAFAAHGTSASQAQARLVLIVDQFEEVFTACGSEDERRVFLHVLHSACTPATEGEAAPAVVLLGLRADFYGRCLDYPVLADALQQRQSVLGAMTAGEVREAVLRPAKEAGLLIEPGLADLVLRDLGVGNGQARRRTGQETYDAGALPLLSHALLATWQRRKTGKLTLSGYRAAGGIHGAVAVTAEQAWAELDPAGRSAARSILLRLVHISEDTHDTRVQRDRADLMEVARNRAAAERAMEVLAGARLVTLGTDFVEITHEALLLAWPRLRGWVDRDRAGLLQRQRLEEEARIWDAHNRDSSLLYRGTRLEAVQQLAHRDDELAATTRTFLTASTRHQRRAMWLRRAAVALVTVFAMIAASVAVVVIRQRDDAEYRQIVSEADRLRDTDPALSAQLDLVAYRLRPDDAEMRSRLVSTQHDVLATSLTGHSGAVYTVAMSPIGGILATGGQDRTARLWNVTDLAHPLSLGPPLTGHTAALRSLAFSPDGHTLATASDDQTTRLWNVTDPAHPTSLGPPLTGHTAALRSLAFSPDGHTLATASQDKTVRLWDTRDVSRPVPLGEPLTAHTGPVWAVLFSPRGGTLATGSYDKTARLWDIRDPAHAVPLGKPLPGHTGAIGALGFSFDGRTLATGSYDKTIRLWDVRDPARAVPIGPPLLGSNSAVYSLAYSPSGYTVAAGSEDNAVRLWQKPSGRLSDHTASVLGVDYRPDGQVLATASEDQTVRLWDATDPGHPTALGAPITGHSDTIWALKFSPDGRMLATASDDRTIRLWDVRDPAHPRPLGAPITGHEGAVRSIAFSPDGGLLATGGSDLTVRLWDLSDPLDVKMTGQPLRGHSDTVWSTSFSPDGHTLATAGGASARLWDVRDPSHPVPSGQPLTAHTGAVWAAKFSPDGRLLATGGSDRTVRLWNVSDPAHAVPLGEPLTGYQGTVWAMAFTPDGHTLASSGYDKTIVLWDLTDPARPVAIGRPLTGHTDTIWAMAYRPDGRFLATGGNDSTTLVWDFDVQRAIQRICGSTYGTMTRELWAQHLPQFSYEPPCDEQGQFVRKEDD
ncbi:hypothetical protein H074_20757 [Amycolatopsis decaplanina DSM 44594]|uniref:Novel STAND NTPase 1 domain-containing protein n=2 Tax=Amycolatopsis decaplanina TaxID=208441 RepID=M2Y7T6_9PSEU|nr:hypothetical protein H074_20757 [Amycolatopsis decaplanina DSM 44594]